MLQPTKVISLKRTLIWLVPLIAVVALISLLIAVGRGVSDDSNPEFEPLGVPDLESINYPGGQPHSEKEVDLGKLLFFDKRLSSNGKFSCASCHNPDLGFGDGVALGVGVMGTPLRRNTPPLYNLAWNTVFFWDGRSASLEEQALLPVVAPDEMNMPLAELIPKLERVPYYVQAFGEIYPESGITAENAAKAIAAFERTIISDNSPFDRYMKGDKSAMSPEAIRGLELFRGKADCVDCHSGPNFTDNGFHNIGLPSTEDKGRGEVVNVRRAVGAFKTPGLRNVLLTAPYMHDGSMKSLEEVVRFYNTGGENKTDISQLIKPLRLTRGEILDLIAFLGALTDPVVIPHPKIPGS